jgi:dTDP-4-amino-4,6-dideoxygalactose transaminase
MPKWTMRRTRNAQALWAACAQYGAVQVPALGEHDDHNVHAHYKCYVYVRPAGLAPGWTRDRIVEAITARGVACFQGSCSEVYLEKAFDGTGWRPAERLPIARQLGENSLMFLVHPTLTALEIREACAVISHVLQQASAIRLADLPALRFERVSMSQPMPLAGPPEELHREAA